MPKTDRTGAIGALIDIYEQAMSELIQTIIDIPDHQMLIITDTKTEDENCRSIQTILTHVVHSGFGYATLINNFKGQHQKRPDKVFHTTITAYVNDLFKVFHFTELVFKDLEDKDLEQFDESQKIATGWGQKYDIEQLTEHAIVHILRHKRQIQNMKKHLLKAPKE